MINNHPGYFHVLRYNKEVHDITLERRSKPNAAMLAFTPLKLDSVNAGWFNYEKLDYLCWEQDHKVYFVFEKVLNTKCTIYLKVIDSLGKSSGFAEVSSLDAEQGVGVELTFSKNEENTLLVVGALSYPSGIVKKTAQLYDINSRHQIWTKRLPHENFYKEKTDGYIVNPARDLFYIHYDIRSVAFIKRGAKEQMIINEFGDIKLFKSAAQSKELTSYTINLKAIEAVYSATLLPVTGGIVFTGHLVEEDFGKKPFLYVEKINDDLSAPVYSRKYPFPLNISEQLTFYDGSDYKDPAFKNYTLKNAFINSDRLYYITERKEENYYKELLSWYIETSTGLLDKVEIIPRKIFYFDDRTRFKKMGECMLSLKNDTLNYYLLEDPANFTTESSLWKYHAFAKQTNLWGATIVSYASPLKGAPKKKRIYTNKNFDLIPMSYQTSGVKDEVFYLNEGSYEKFGFIFSPNP